MEDWEWDIERTYRDIMKATDYRLKPSDIDDMTLAQLLLYFEPTSGPKIAAAELNEVVRQNRQAHAETLPPDERERYLEQLRDWERSNGL